MQIEVQGHVVTVDDDDAWRLLSEKWGIQPMPTKHREYFYVRKYERKDNRQIARLLHREITGASPGEIVDHINGDRLDNRRANLRVCTHAENMRNRAMHANNGVGYKGVMFCKQKGLYRARITFAGVQYHAGYASTALDAARLYDQKARELHGEFARCNLTDTVTA